MAPTRGPRSVGSRIFRALLRVLPFDFRDEHGRELEQVFRAQREGARRDGSIRALVRLWFETVSDLLTTAPQQHAAILRQDVAYTLRTALSSSVKPGRLTTKILGRGQTDDTTGCARV